MAADFTIKILERTPTVDEYQLLRRTTGWIGVSDEQVVSAMSNTLFAVCAFHENQLAGAGRVVGDGGLYFYIQDVIVLPAFKGKGIGNKIMEVLERFIQKTAKGPVFVGLMAAKGVQGFYEKLGYQARDGDSPGMYKYVNPG